MGVSSETEGFELVDPLVDKSTLSLFPRSFKSSSLSSSASSSNPNSSIFDALDAHLKARVLSSPDKLLKQTKTILEENALVEKQKVPRERRPALGLKRAKFSAKPIPSQPAATLEFSIDVDKLSDPEEYFAAYERMENAKKEVQRLNGEPLLELDQNRVSSAPSRRRPGLLGRSATYANRFRSSISVAEVDETLLPAQETFDNDIRSPAHNDVVPDAKVINNSPNVREPESKSTTISKVSKLDELLSSNYEELNKDEVEDVLRDKLQIKNVDIGKTFFPDWRVQLRESLASSSALQKKNNIVVHLSGKSKATRIGDQVSPAKSRSPLASISLLNRHIARRSPSMDQFSPLQIDLSPAKATDRTSEPDNRVDQAGQSDEVNARENSHEFRRSTAHEEESNAVSGDDTFVSVAKDVDPISKPKEKEDVVGQCDPISSRTDSCEFGRSPVHVEKNIAGADEDRPALTSNDVGPTSESERYEDEVDATLSPGQQLNFEGLDKEKSSSYGVEKGGTSEPSNTENIAVEEPTEETVRSSKRRLKEKEISEVPSEAVVAEGTAKKGQQAKTKSTQSEASISAEARNKRRKVEGARPGLRKGTKELRRTSLYYAGTKLEAGVRRSTRIRMRPLEYWRGERFLYGRVHQSLVTVIGVKYASPSKNAEEPKVKVKSFVSDEYKDLVELASLH
ncbi:centromere protein C-like isoform X2 [Chenopodium quinoa]|uniref:Centromere protein C n=1 Tax=Chenopodium quinoa TaxID=63459 RepID=A0A803LEL0_CHEQI|nr:centromere protein C-like isoform X2 [Chenopodium quinoa]